MEGHEKYTKPSFHIQQDEDFIHCDIRDWSTVDSTLGELSKKTTGYG
jgi:hypothetical protein